jgi:hypothetical protein
MATAKFNPEHPETFPWRSLDSRIASEAGQQIADAAKEQCRRPCEDRFALPGLRESLRILWNVVHENRR